MCRFRAWGLTNMLQISHSARVNSSLEGQNPNRSISESENILSKNALLLLLLVTSSDQFTNCYILFL